MICCAVLPLYSCSCVKHSWDHWLECWINIHPVGANVVSFSTWNPWKEIHKVVAAWSIVDSAGRLNSSFGFSSELLVRVEGSLKGIKSLTKRFNSDNASFPRGYYRNFISVPVTKSYICHVTDHPRKQQKASSDSVVRYMALTPTLRWILIPYDLFQELGVPYSELRYLVWFRSTNVWKDTENLAASFRSLSNLNHLTWISNSKAIFISLTYPQNKWQVLNRSFTNQRLTGWIGSESS